MSAPPSPADATGRNWWRSIAWLVPAAVLAAAVIVLLAIGFRSTAAGGDFIRTYPGASELPAGAPVGIPAWLGWQHYLNALFLVLIVRTGLQVRADARGSHAWTGHARRGDKPPHRMTLELWTHLAVDTLWIANGVIYVVVLFATGQWVRVVPTSWDVVPNAVSSALQYASLDWPTENGWVNYNALQLLSYFAVVFLAAPLAIVTGIRLSSYWPSKWRRARWYPLGLARTLHYPTMLFFVAFVIVHVTLVLTTGAVRNLNHIYASQDTHSWVGFGIFAASSVLLVLAWFAARPVITRPVAQLFGEVVKTPPRRQRPPRS